MAEEELAPTEELEPIDAPVDGSEDEVEIASPPSIDDYARSRGWTSKEEWVAAGKDEADWRSSEEFLNFGLDQSSGLKREMKGLRETVEAARQASTIAAREAAEQARQQEKERWEKAHKEAVQLGDEAQADIAKENLIKVAAPINQGPDPLVAQFQAENTWYNADSIARSVAVAAAETVKHLPVADQLAAAKEAVHKRFPEYAPEPEKKLAKAVEVAKPAGTATAPKRGKTFHDLPKENQEAARALKEAGMLPNGIDGYVKNYFNKEGTVL